MGRCHGSGHGSRECFGAAGVLLCDWHFYWQVGQLMQFGGIEQVPSSVKGYQGERRNGVG